MDTGAGAVRRPHPLSFIPGPASATAPASVFVGRRPSRSFMVAVPPGGSVCARARAWLLSLPCSGFEATSSPPPARHWPAPARGSLPFPGPASDCPRSPPCFHPAPAA